MKPVFATLVLPLCLLILVSADRDANAQTSEGASRIVVRLPVARSSPHGELVMQPNVSVEGAASGEFLYHQPLLPAPVLADEDPVVGMYGSGESGELTYDGAPRTYESGDIEGIDSSEDGRMFGFCRPALDYICNEFRGGTDCEECSPLHRMFGFDVHQPTFDKGIGLKRVPLALMEMDITQPLNNYRARFIMNYDTPTPDRAEYLWKASAFGGPGPERSLDWQEIRVVAETGGERFSLFTEYPLRILDPEWNGNTAGFGDMQIGNKLVLIDGNDWQVTQIFRTWLPTGSSKKGLGTGWTRMEPGILARFRWTDRTYLHYELKYNFQIGGSPNFGGQVLRYGFGISHLLHETDTFAFIPTLEFVGFGVMDGQKTLPDGSIVPVDGENFMSILPGARMVLGPAGDLGLFEVGVAGGINTNNNGFYNTQLQFDLRFSY